MAPRRSPASSPAATRPRSGSSTDRRRRPDGRGRSGRWNRACGPPPAGGYVLFTDADIVHPPDSVGPVSSPWRRAASRDIVSVLARLRCDTGSGERLLVPAFAYLFALLYPFRFVNDDRRRCAAARGGCLLVRVGALERSGGLEAIAGALIDDVSLAAAVSRCGREDRGHLWLGLNPDVSSCRPYPHLADIWRMVTRSAYTQLRYSPLVLIGTVGGPPPALRCRSARSSCGALGAGPTACWVPRPARSRGACRRSARCPRCRTTRCAQATPAPASRRRSLLPADDARLRPPPSRWHRDQLERASHLGRRAPCAEGVAEAELRTRDDPVASLRQPSRSATCPDGTRAVATGLRLLAGWMMDFVTARVHLSPERTAPANTGPCARAG